MTELNEEDWLLVNGYHDNELPAARRAAFAVRLRREPALAEALAQLQALSGGLGKLRPTAASALPAARRPWGRISAGALAAALAVALLVGLRDPADPAGAPARQVHAGFAEQEFSVDPARFSRVSAPRPDGLPDLGPARLALVSRRDVAGGVAAHYAGVNDCRLTFFDTEAPLSLEASDALRMAAWHNGRRYFTILAEGMDPDRFQAIATYLIGATGQGAAPGTRMALLDATRKATSCP